MNIPKQKKNGGYVLLIVMVMSVIGLMFMAGAMNWSQNTSTQTARNNEYFTTGYAAEAATAKAMAKIVTDYKTLGEGVVFSRMAQNYYQTNVPNSSDGTNGYWSSYQFNNGFTNVTGQMTMTRITNAATVYMKSPYAGLYSLAATYQVVAGAKNTTSRYQIPAAVGSEVNLGKIPIFQFAIFYDQDMEIAPGPDMVVTGLVHCNHDIYVSPGASLTFNSDVSASGSIIPHVKPGNGAGDGGGTATYDGAKLTNVSTLTLPISTNNTHAILEVPPFGESNTTGFGTNRFFNQADIVVVLSNSSLTVRSGLFNNGTIPITNWQVFLNTNNTFYNIREAATVKAITLDVGKLRGFSHSNMCGLTGSSALNREISSIYIADMRTMASSNESGIVLTNGKYLPPLGLTVATPNPAYTIGDYNTSIDGSSFYPNTNETSHTFPAAIMCDAINILSTAWNPANSSSNLSVRAAAATTVNAAFLSGIVATTGTSLSPGAYSGGVENFPRFLEDWNPGSGQKTFTYNGSMVVLYTSTNEADPWLGTGSGPNVYNPPVRHWAFDQNYMDARKQPPLTPSVTVVTPARWSLIAPNTTNF